MCGYSCLWRDIGDGSLRCVGKGRLSLCEAPSNFNDHHENGRDIAKAIATSVPFQPILLLTLQRKRSHQEAKHET
jgi:hypothetical protein